MRRDATNSAVRDGIAKQMPCAPAMIAVLTPMTSPRVETSGPPELPGLSAASVWTTPSMSRPLCERMVRPSALTTPEVTVAWKPERIADRDDELARAQRRRVAEGGEARRCVVDLHDGEIGVGIVADEIRGMLLPSLNVARMDGGAAHDVAVRERESVRREKETGAGALYVARVASARGRPDLVISRWTTAGPTRSTAPTIAREYASSRSSSCETANITCSFILKKQSYGWREGATWSRRPTRVNGAVENPASQDGWTVAWKKITGSLGILDNYGNVTVVPALIATIPKLPVIRVF